MLILYIIIATLATGVVYLLAGGFLESQFTRPLTVAIMLLVTGLIVFASDYARDGSIPASSMGIIRSTIIGLIQGIAIMPGISRSGSTIGSSVMLGIKRKDAAAFSFLLSIPAILAGNLKEFAALKSLQGKMLFTYILGFLFAFAVGYLVIAFLIRLIENSRLKYFSYYCWFIGGLSIILIVT
jgi:undecaprenyl-diphosphatase